MFSHLYNSSGGGGGGNGMNQYGGVNWNDVSDDGSLFLTDDDVLSMAEGLCDDSNAGNNQFEHPQNISTQFYQPPTPVVPPMFNFQLQHQNFLSVIHEKQQEPPQQQVVSSPGGENSNNTSSDQPNPRKRSRKEIETDQQELDKLLEIPEKKRTENQKKQILKLRNRQTAKRSRDRKKLEFEATMEENRKLTILNKELTEEVKSLKMENAELKRTIEMFNANTRDSPDSYVSLTINEEQDRAIPDVESFLSQPTLVNNNAPTIPVGMQHSSNILSPMFSFSFSAEPTPQKKSKMYMIVFFVACVCCFFIGTTLVNELPGNSLLISKSKVHDQEMRIINSAAVVPEIAREEISMIREAIVAVPKSMAYESPAVLQAKRFKSKGPSRLSVQMNPDMSAFIKSQFQENETAVLLEFNIGVQSAFVFTSVSSALTPEEQSTVISDFKDSVERNIQLMCKITDKPKMW